MNSGCSNDKHPELLQDSENEKTKQTKYLCGLAVKKDTTYWNLIVMPLLPFITCTVNFYAMAFMPILLQSKDYYAIPENDLGKATS